MSIFPLTLVTVHFHDDLYVYAHHPGREVEHFCRLEKPLCPPPGCICAQVGAAWPGGGRGAGTPDSSEEAAVGTLGHWCHLGGSLSLEKRTAFTNKIITPFSLKKKDFFFPPKKD